MRKIARVTERLHASINRPAEERWAVRLPLHGTTAIQRLRSVENYSPRFRAAPVDCC
ncbi:hypothetical protein [Lacipirellula limnantheis]|uniref:hypothetical protein n=1 Tax=Lacipirellula limnantheis TaxID=2528024 RepID=UPI00143DACDE|nr:hypothetical protein [Lacipirellula limnantheis]